MATMSREIQRKGTCLWVLGVVEVCGELTKLVAGRGLTGAVSGNGRPGGAMAAESVTKSGIYTYCEKLAGECQAVDKVGSLLYIDVHMNTTVSISQFRKNLFTYADLIVNKGYEVEVEKDGKKVFRAVKVDEDDAKKRAKKLLEISKKMAGKWKDVNFDREFFRGKKELKYWKRYNW